jgi:hypothetical protein
MLDPTATHLEVEVGGLPYAIQQSSGLLKSARDAGTTGAMLWKVTPLIANWLASTTSILWSVGLLSPSSNIVELGCGIAGLIGQAVSPFVASYVLTDQDYVMKLLKSNLLANQKAMETKQRLKHLIPPESTLHVLPLDWENDSVENLLCVVPSMESIDMLILCDCIYNTYLIKPLLQTCLEICQLATTRPTLLLIAQQLRTDDVFEEWISSLLKLFVVYRINDTHLPQGIRNGSGYAVHLAVLRDVPVF